MLYNVFKENQNLTDKQRNDNLQTLLESAAYKVIHQYSSDERNINKTAVERLFVI